MNRCIVLFLALVAGICPANCDVTPTQDKFSAELKADLISRVSFSKVGNAIQIHVKAKATLPLEFVKGKGLEASDGILLEGDEFAWPGCGFDRTSYQIKKIAPEYVEIGYSRGIPQQDGFHDSGVFRVDYEKKK
jgi:hypothetical protein